MNNRIEPPPDAVAVGKWESHDGHVERFFRGTQRGAQTQMPVEIVGFQSADGSVSSRTVMLGNDGIEINAGALQGVIDHLAAARDEVTLLAEMEGPHTEP